MAFTKTDNFIYKTKLSISSPNSDLRVVPLVGALSQSSVGLDKTLNECDLFIKRYKIDYSQDELLSTEMLQGHGMSNKRVLK